MQSHKARDNLITLRSEAIDASRLFSVTRITRCIFLLWPNGAAAYLSGKADPLVRISALNKMIDDWREFFKECVDSVLAEKMRRHEQTGRPLGSEKFVLKLEKILDRMLLPKKAGRPRKLI